jgi:hypothetical protein
MLFEASFSRIVMVPFEPLRPKARLIARRMITVNEATTGCIGRSRYDTSATSTSIREAYDAYQGWGGRYISGYSLLLSLHPKTPLK